MSGVFFFFFFQAEDGIRDLYVTGVQTCALPISPVPGLHPTSASKLLFSVPGAQRFRQVARISLQTLRQRHLMPEVVTDHPFAPGDLYPVDIFSKACQEAGVVFRSRWSGIKCLPVCAGEVDLHPAVRVTCADDVIAAEFIEFAR